MNFHYKSHPPPFVLVECPFGFRWRLHLPSLQIVPPNRFSFYLTPDWGLLLTLDWMQQHFVGRSE